MRIRERIIKEVDGVIDVVVKAKQEEVVFCSLLTAIEDSDVENHISATVVEEEARPVLGAHTDVTSMQGVTQANVLASTLRKNLESSDEIDQANIFLYLNLV